MLFGMPTGPSSCAPADVIILGGGVAALEAMMALRELAGDRVRVWLVSASEDFVERPMSVAEPFGLGVVRRYPLCEIAADFGARFVHAAAIGVDAREPRLVFSDGATLAGSTLILAPGARTLAAFPEAITFGLQHAGEAVRELLGDLVRGAVRRVAFVAPSLAGWTLPLYELALLTARTVTAAAIKDVSLHLITPELQPLAVFGAQPSAIVAQLLAGAGIEFHGETYVDLHDGAVVLRRGARSIRVDRIVALPLVRGPELSGVPRTPPHDFIPVDRHGVVRGRSGVYAAGDATDFPVKQGGIAAQQADAVARHVAARHGAQIQPAPFAPVLRGMLLTGDAPHFMRSRAAAGDDAVLASWQPLWWPPTKIAGRHLAPYLFARDTGAPTRPESGFVDVDVQLDATTTDAR
jgi:sulfide:quinone oxidoreductase